MTATVYDPADDELRGEGDAYGVTPAGRADPADVPASPGIATRHVGGESCNPRCEGGPGPADETPAPLPDIGRVFGELLDMPPALAASVREMARENRRLRAENVEARRLLALAVSTVNTLVECAQPNCPQHRFTPEQLAWLHEIDARPWPTVPR